MNNPDQTRPVQVTSLRDDNHVVREDRVAVEEPLEIRIAGESIAVTMRTPGHDEELAAGFIFTEGIVGQSDQIHGVAHATSPRGQPLANIVAVSIDPSVVVDMERAQRNFYSTSSCGICGKASIEQVRQRVRPVESNIQISQKTLTDLPDRMREAQRVFGETGGIHAAALFDAKGDLLCVREDVGRHNAVDKVIGWAVLNSTLPLEQHIFMLSGRASFEIVQKALVARIPIVAAVSAPSSLAVALAQENNLTLIGFLRGASMNIYTGGERIAPALPTR